MIRTLLALAAAALAASDDTVYCVDIELFDSVGDGWSGDYYSIVDSSGAVVQTGTHPSGSVWTEQVCLSAGECYSLEVGGGTWQSEVSWAFGELAGGAPYGPEALSVARSHSARTCPKTRARETPKKTEPRRAVCFERKC